MPIALRPLCGLLIALSSLDAAAAGVYRCLDEQGRTQYQQTPCASAGAGAGPVSLPPLNLLGGGLRRGERDLLESSSGREGRARKARESRRRRSAASEAHRERQARSCWKREQRLQQVNRELRRGYRPARGVRLRDRRRELEDYLRRFCR